MGQPEMLAICARLVWTIGSCWEWKNWVVNRMCPFVVYQRLGFGCHASFQVLSMSAQSHQNNTISVVPKKLSENSGGTYFNLLCHVEKIHRWTGPGVPTTTFLLLAACCTRPRIRHKVHYTCLLTMSWWTLSTFAENYAGERSSNQIDI